VVDHWKYATTNVLSCRSNDASVKDIPVNKLCGRPPQYAPASCKLTFDLLTLKVVSESRVLSAAFEASTAKRWDCRDSCRDCSPFASRGGSGGRVYVILKLLLYTSRNR